MNCMFNNENAADKPLIMRIRSGNYIRYVVTSMPYPTERSIISHIKTSFQNNVPLKCEINGFHITSYNATYKQVEDYITRGKLPQGCFSIRETPFLLDMYYAFKHAYEHKTWY
ncbi:MAG: hypothetical protein MJ244_03040 [Clostridia bacterium]|nr:hypothetical protein [Clostridia bacterium]